MREILEVLVKVDGEVFLSLEAFLLAGFLLLFVLGLMMRVRWRGGKRSV